MATWEKKVYKSAFTLIELLVVIAIIAILAAILFPVFATAREKARQTSCANNEKQLGIAFLSYAQDFDEVLPIGSENTAPNDCWDKLIVPYAMRGLGTYSASSLYHCPDDNYTTGFVTRTYSMNGANASGVFGLGPAGMKIDATTYVRCPLSIIPSPSNVFLLVENPYPNNIFGSNSGAQQGCPISSGTINCQDQQKNGVQLHSKGWNYLYCDGHVKWMTPESTIRTPGRTYPIADTPPAYQNSTATGSWNCPGTGSLPCGPWTISDND